MQSRISSQSTNGVPPTHGSSRHMKGNLVVRTNYYHLLIITYYVTDLLITTYRITYLSIVAKMLLILLVIDFLSIMG